MDTENRMTPRAQRLVCIMAMVLLGLTAGCDDAQSPDTSSVDGDVLPDAAPMPTGPGIETGSTRLSFDAESMTLTLNRGDDELLRFPLNAFQLATVDSFDPALNYDPYYLWTGVQILPPDLAWHIPTAISEETSEDGLRFTVEYAEIGTAELHFSVDAIDRLSAQFVPPSEPSVIFTRFRPLGDATEGFYGLGEYFDDVNHRGKVRALQFELDPEIDSGHNEAHIPIPFIVGTRGWGLFVASFQPGVFAVAVDDDEAVDITFATNYGAPEPVQFYLFTEDHPLDLTQHYYEITGFPRLPADWALGPWIWRDENEDQAEVIDDIETIRNLDLATSGYWIDRPYASGVNSFDFKPEQFPEPDAMIARMHELGYRIALWHTPYVGEDQEATADLHAEAEANGYYPAESGLIVNNWGRPVDLTNPAAYDWWQGLIRRYTDRGVEGFKLDYGQDIALGLFLQRNVWAFHDGSDERTQHAIYQDTYHNNRP